MRVNFPLFTVTAWEMVGDRAAADFLGKATKTKEIIRRAPRHARHVYLL